MNEKLCVEYTEVLTEEQVKKILSLVGCCHERDCISLSYPFGQEDGPVSHYLLTDGNGRLLSVLSVSFWEKGLAECTAFTHPDFRRRGYFTRLLETALEVYEEDDLLFPVSEGCRDTIAALDSLGAEFQFREHMMACDLTADSSAWLPSHKHALLLQVPDDLFSENACWTLYLSKSRHEPASSRRGHAGLCREAVGSCLTSPASPGCLCLHHVEIQPDMRRLGFGFSLICQLLDRLRRANVRQVILQVSGQNEAALALYKKAGFRITETLSYYLL